MHTLIDNARYRPLPPGRRSAGFSLVDAFSPDLYTGNPAAVVRLAAFDEIDLDAMQQIAAELKAPATAFIAPADVSDEEAEFDAAYDIRWFSVTTELPICGHATFGAAKALLASGVHPLGSTMIFRSHLGGGDLAIRSDLDETLELALPSLPPTPDPTLTDTHSTPRAELDAALGIENSGENAVLYVGRNKYDIIVELDSVAAVDSLAPNYDLLKAIDCRGVIVTAAGSSTQCPAHWPTADFVSRFFGPSMGIPEDSATGSAQCALAPYWADRLGRTDGLVSLQASSRGGCMELALRRAEPTRSVQDSVVLRSVAQVVVDGTITLPSLLA